MTKGVSQLDKEENYSKNEKFFQNNLFLKIQKSIQNISRYFSKNSSFKHNVCLFAYNNAF